MLTRTGVRGAGVAASWGLAEPPGGPRGAAEWGAILLLPLGSLVVPVVGWAAGVYLLWRSRAWTAREKLLGTLVLPGGLLLPLWLYGALGASQQCSTFRGPSAPGHIGVQTLGALHTHCTSNQSVPTQIVVGALIAACVAASLLSAIYLWWRSNGPRTA